MLRWKLLVTSLAWGIKVAGNKIMLKLTDKMPMWLCDFQLYGYQYSTATILRILQLSIPDENTAQIVGLCSAVGEMAVRIYFFNSYLKRGLANKHMNKEETYKYAMHGKLRVQDASNDMVVEYMSAITAALYMLILSPTGAFSFASDADISTSSIIKLCAYQLVPELFIDFYCTFMEINNGIRALHESYWKADTGSEKDSKFWVKRRGDLIRATIMKMCATVAIIAFTLAVSLK